MTHASRWLPAGALVLVGALLLARGLTAGAADLLIIGVTAVVCAWWLSPLRGRGPTHRAVTAAPTEHPVVVYWRPGCLYCTRLRGALGKHAKQATWVSIWADEEAAAFVRSVNGGDETVPTVVVDGRAHTNPDPEVVLAALR